MDRKRMTLRLALVLLVAALATTPTTAVAPDLPALGKLQDGVWELRFRDGTPSRRLCLHDRWQLIQLEHPDLACDRLVIENGADAVAVQYTCRRRGFGLTRVRRESAQLFQLETQGLAQGVPFELSAEGRRVGDCLVAGR